MRAGLCGGLAALVVLIGPSAAWAGMIQVDDDGVQCPAAAFASVAAAVASAVSGDTVQVCDGIYVEPAITITQDVVLTSLNGPAVTFIQGNGSPAYVVHIDADNVAVSGLDIGNAAYVGPQEAGLILAGNQSGLNITGNVLHDPRTGPNPVCDNFGGAFGITFNDVQDVTIDGNTIFNVDNPCVPAMGSSVFRSRARAIFLRGAPGTGGGQIAIVNNDIDNVVGNRAGGINLIVSATFFSIAGNSISTIVDTGQTFGSFGIEADVGIDGATTTNEITGNSIDTANIAVRLAEDVSDVEVTGNTYTSLVPFTSGGPPLNGTLGPNGVGTTTGNFLCGNTDDPAATYNVVPNDGSVAGNTFPNGSSFPGNFDCPEPVPSAGTLVLVLTAAMLLAGCGLSLAARRREAARS